MKHSPKEPAAVWHAACATRIGAGHLRRELPCQDAARAGAAPRPHAIVCDGRGSAPRSHEGSRRAVAAFARCMTGHEPFLGLALDAELAAGAALGSWNLVARSLFHTLAAEQLELAEEFELRPKDFDFTLSCAVLGKRHLGWIRVGDNQLVVQRNGILGVAEVPEEFDFANQTRFVRPGDRAASHLSCGVIPAEEVEGVAVFTDGVSPKMLSAARSHPSIGFSEIFLQCAAASEDFSETLEKFLARSDWEPAVQDDRGLAVLAHRSLAETKPQPAESEEDSRPVSASGMPTANPAPGPDTAEREFLVFFLAVCAVVLFTGAAVTVSFGERRTAESPSPSSLHATLVDPRVFPR
jgi:hypothetical protein